MALVGRKFRVILIGMVATFLMASPAGAQQNAIVDQYADNAVCQAVINIIINNNLENEVVQETAKGDNTNEIAQDLNISPVIVQKCAEKEIEDKEKDQDKGKTTKGSTTKGTTTKGTTGATTPETSTEGTTPTATETPPEGEGEVIQSSIPPKDLPNTSGPELLLPAAALLLGVGLLTLMVLRRR